MCNLCKSTDHKARACQFSWARDTRETSDPESEPVTEETPEKTATDDPEVLPMTEECDGLLTGQPDAEDNNNSDTQDEFMDAPESDDTVSNEPTDSAELFLSTSTEETPYSLTPAQQKQPAKSYSEEIPNRSASGTVCGTRKGLWGRPATIHHKPWEGSLDHPPHPGHASASLLGLLAKSGTQVSVFLFVPSAILC